MKQIVYGFMVTAITLSMNLVCNSQEWSQFMGYSRNGTVNDFTVPGTWPAELKQVWKINVGTGDASPVYAEKKIFLHTRQGDEEVILCLDAGTGKEIWKSTYQANPVTGPSASHPGPRSTPAISDGKIVTLGATGIIACLDIKNGKVLWKKENPSNTVPQFFIGMSPLIINSLCILHTGTKDNGVVSCLDLKTGNEKWKWTGEGPSYSSPSIMEFEGRKHVVVVTEKNLISLNLDNGKLLWQVSAPVQQRFYNCVSPLINGQSVILTGQGSGIKAYKIEKQGDQLVPKEMWNNPAVGAKWNTPVLKNGYLYGFTDTKRIYCINYENGQTAWIDETVNSDFSTLVNCGSVLAGLTQTGNLIWFKPDYKNYIEVAKYKVSETAVYTFPLIKNNSIYIKDAESLALYQF